MAMTDLTIIARSMRSRLFSTCVTVLTVAVAVGLLLVLLNLRQAASVAFARGTGNMHLLISRESSGLESVLNCVFYAKVPSPAIPWAKVEQIRNSYPNEWLIPTQQGDSYRGLPVMATTREFFERFKPDGVRPWALRSGEFFDAPFEIVLGSRAASTLGMGVGDEIELMHDMNDVVGHRHDEFEFTVVGVLEPTGSSHDRAVFADVRGAWIIHAHDRREKADPSIHETTESDLTDADRLVTGLYMRLPTREGSEVSSVMQQVFDMMRRDRTITVAQPGKEIQNLMNIVGDIDILFFAMAGVVMIGSGISIMLALYNSMDQRRRQIAVLRVLGSSRGRILMLVLTESALLGVLGVVVGVLLAVIGGVIAAGALSQSQGLLIEPTLDLQTTLWVGLATVGLASLAGLVPSILAYRTSVAKHLRPIG